MTDERIIAYLLDQLAEDEAERFNEELAATEEWPIHVRWVEDELIDDYLRDQLPTEQRERFEKYYLWSEARREKVAVAAAILQRAGESAVDPAPTPAARGRGWKDWSGWGFSLRLAGAAALLVVAVGIVWLVGFRTRTPQTFATLTVQLTDATRGEGPAYQRIKLPLDKDALELRVELPSQAPAGDKYQIELDQDGRRIPVKPERREGNQLILIVPASELKPGRYLLRLNSLGEGIAQRLPGSGKFIVE